MKELCKKISRFFEPREKQYSEKTLKKIEMLNKYSLIFHVLLAGAIVFVVEIISRRDLSSAFSFVDGHTYAYLYNVFLVFASLTMVYMFRRRAFARVIISGFWLILGIINGCILSNRVTPFGYTDLKCISDLFTMTNTKYFTAQEAILVVLGLGMFIAFCVFFYFRGPKFAGKLHRVVAPILIATVLFIGIPVTTSAAQNSNVVASYFANIAQGYENYGFIYGFSSSVFDRGMSEPSGYSEDKVKNIVEMVEEDAKETALVKEKAPNIICVLLESFCDPEEINFLSCNTDPIPTFHALEENFSTGYLTVPVVGAGTANTEFEILTGMSMQFFGTGEYPYKTILKQTDCEAIGSDLSKLGYGTHVVHNNGGNFYSRVNAFSQMGFDSFTSKELMNITEYTPNGGWAADDILVEETIKTLDSTPNAPDFTYTITVSSHGDYPETEVIKNPAYTISGVEDEGKANSWTYYVNQLNAVDNFIRDLITELSARDEDTIVVMFGDHLPTMGLTDADMRTESIYKTKYITWNNMELPKEDADLYAYQLLAHTMDTVGIHEGTVFNFHQTQANQENYLNGLETLQYDILYGKRYCYDGENPYPATDIVMGVEDVVFSSITEDVDGEFFVLNGENFTKWSKVFVDGKKVTTEFVNDRMLKVKKSSISIGDHVLVNQMGSSNTVFRSSNELCYTISVTNETTEQVEETELLEEVSFVNTENE